MIYACLRVKGRGAGGGMGITFHGLVFVLKYLLSLPPCDFPDKRLSSKTHPHLELALQTANQSSGGVLCFSAAGTNWINLSPFKVGEVVFCHVPVLIS